MKYMKINWKIILILALTSVLRFWNLGNVPPHLTPDEASLGYNAYSILKTGKDEYGTFLPTVFKSFGDFKPGFYVYLTVPFVAIFGLNEWSVRLPSAVSGVITVWLLYLIVRKLFTEHRSLATVAAFVAATNPWLIYFSRGAWEVNLALCLTLAGIYFLLRSFDNQRYFVLCVLSFAITLVTYQGAKLSTGIVVLILLILYWKEILKFGSKSLALGLVAGLVISLPIFLSFFTGQTGRLNVFSVFSYPRPKEYLQAFLDEGGEKVGDINYYLFHTETYNFARGVLGRYFNHFSDRFLFFEGDWANPRHTAPNHGMLLLSDIVLLVLGFVALVRYGAKSLSAGRQGVWFIWLWLLLAPLPSALSRDQVHAVRALNESVPMIILLAFGLWYLIGLVMRSRMRVFLCAVVCMLYVGSILYFLDTYFIHLPAHDSKLWEYGYKQIVQTVTPIQKAYKAVKVQQSFAQPYIYFLFFQKYNPAKYQKQAKLVASEYKNDVGYVTKIDNIEFVPIDWSVVRGERGTLFVADPIRIPPEDSKDENQFSLIREIKYLNNRDIAFRIIEVK